MVKNNRKQYSREDAMKSLEFLQSAVDGIRHVMIGILSERMEAAQNLEPEEDDEFPPVVMAINPTGFYRVQQSAAENAEKAEHHKTAPEAESYCSFYSEQGSTEDTGA